MSYQTLQIVGQLTPELGNHFARLTWQHGDGFMPSELIGHDDGVRFYRYVFRALPNRSTHTVNDPEDGDTPKTWERYLRAFFSYRQVDGEPFYVTDQRLAESIPESSSVLVVFADHQLDETLFSKELYRCEIRLREYRSISE